MDDYKKKIAEAMAPAKPQAKQSLGPRTFTHKGKQVTLSPLQSEDGATGYWDAKRQGNGKGRSFYSVNNEVTYLD